MEISTKIKDGVHLDNNVYDQPENTMRDSLNGIITDNSNGYYKWSNIKGNSLSFGFPVDDRYMAHCLIKDRLFVITLNTVSQLVKIHEITLLNNIGTVILKLTMNNSDMNMSFEWPIRTIWGFYENENIQRIYWSDWHNSPRCLNMGPFGSTVTVDPKFMNFVPVIDKLYGEITNTTITSGGSLKAGTYFFAWRYYTNDGYYTDWSYITNPIQVTFGTPGLGYEAYQRYEGSAPNFNTGNKITIELSDIDNDYDNIQICAFYSNDYNIAEPGFIFYDGEITGAVMTVSFIGTENAGTVVIDDLIETTLNIEKLKDSVTAKKQNVIACIDERAELSYPASLQADIQVGISHIPLDMFGYLDKMTHGGDVKSLHGVWNCDYDESHYFLRRGQWYKAITQVVWNDGGGNITVPINNVFYVGESLGTVTYISGTFQACVVTKKYLKAGGISGADINTNYSFKCELLGNEFYDWKSHKVSKTYKSYPQGETVRVGVLFFDKTGRPFFVRHLYNTNLTYGPCDTVIPKRSNTNPMLTLSQWFNVGTDGYYQNAVANLQHLKISNLDITDVADKIGGFMIVRSPIIHQYIGMGVLLPTYLHNNDVYAFPGFWNYGSFLNNYFGCYDLFCPEDLFNLKDFSIQENDEIENIVYLDPYARGETTSGYQGLGRQECDTFEFYQKFLRETLPADICPTNGPLGVSHKVTAVTKFVLGDDDLQINPIDPTKLYHPASYATGITIAAKGYVNNHSVLILDITDDLVDLKAPSPFASQQDSPMALLCAVKRPNSNPYGGSSDSSFANTVYMTTGHYQEINPTVLADVLSGGRYIFNEIDVYGGDTFVQLFDMKRLYKNYDLAQHVVGHGMIFPVESRINIAMREGNHLSKTRSFDSAFNTSGLKLETGSTVLEEYSYNDGFSTDNIGDLYLPLPFHYTLTNEFLSRIRYSPEKNYGEMRDNFRRFLANDYIDLDPNKGTISNIRYKSNRLIYWQPDEIGYIPLQERALTQNSTGEPVQLGVGGLFERYDQLVDKLGNSHQFGLIESPLGYHWYDSRRKIYLSVSFGLQITKDSILKGMDKFFKDNIIDDLDLYDNPFSITPGGLFGGYDPESKMAFSTFIIPGMLITRHTIGVNTILNKFTGKYSFYPGAYITTKNHLFHVTSDLQNVYVHGTGSYNTFFESVSQAYVSLIIKEASNTTKIFDIFELIGNSNMFTSIIYENSNQYIEEIISTYPGGILTIQNRNYEYLKCRWFGNFPKVSRERINDGYLKITFKMVEPYPVELFEFKSMVRKIY